MEELEEIIETMKEHEAFVDMKRSAGVMTPSGPSSEYKEFIEIHFKNIELVADWRATMKVKIPVERRSKISGLVVLFYQYKEE